MKEKLLLVLCSFSIICASFTTIYACNTEKEKEKAKENKTELSWNNLFIEDGEEKYTEEDIIIDGVIPNYFNSSIYDNITCIKDQDDYSTCWAFAAISAMESSLVRNNDCDKSIDLSEAQLAYYTYFRPYSEQTNDIFGIKKDFKFTEVGLSQYGTMMSLASGYGVVTEDKMEYTRFYEEPEYDDYYFYNTDYLVRNIFQTDMTNPNTVKKAIINYGSVVAAFNNNHEYYNENTYSYYQNKTKDSDHAVVIIGWNDDYPKENFKKIPSRNGAWLIKNSYGKDWGQYGYGWISYEDLSIKNSEITFFELEENKKQYLNKYQYDGTISSYYLEDIQAQSNIFTASNNELLTDISFFTQNYDLKHKISIYTNVKDEPTDGKLIVSFNAETEYKGYHTIELPKKILLEKGTVFSIVIESFDDKDDETAIYVDCSDDLKEWQCNANAIKGQSYVKFSGKWYDAAEKYDANCRIKALTKESTK